MENAVNTNGRREKFPAAESQYFFKHEKEERSKLFDINKLIDDENSIWFVSTANKIYEETL